MSNLISTVQSYVKNPKKRYDSDQVDQWNFLVTPVLLNTFGLLLAMKQYFGTPIQCWVPAHFTDDFEEYTENYCFIENTHFVRPEDMAAAKTEGGDIRYYQWVPFFLFFQAGLFYIPQVIWSYLNTKSGTPLGNLVKMSLNLSLDSTDNSKQIDTVAMYIYRGVSRHKDLKREELFSLVHRSRYLVTIYLFIKVLYLAQIFLQYYLMHLIIGSDSFFWGYEFAMNALNGKHWEETGHFPRETMCDFDVRQLGTIHHWSVQCVLLVNMINEKIYLFIWFYLILVFAFTFLSLLSWTYKLFSASNRYYFVKKHMAEVFEKHGLREESFNSYVNSFLKMDGVFCMMLIANNAGSLVTIDLFTSLWKIYLDKNAVKEEVLQNGKDKISEEKAIEVEEISSEEL